MSFFDDTIPSDDEAARIGAQRIREIKAALNPVLAVMVDDSGDFLSNWVTGAMIQSDASNDSNRAITTNHLKNGLLTLAKFTTAMFTADTGGRAPFASGFVNAALLDPAITFPTGSVTSGAIADDAVLTAAINAGAVTIAKVAAGVAKIAIGSYAGSASVSASISGLAFAPDFVILVGGNGVNRTGLAFRQEGSGDPVIGNIHSLWDNGNVGGTNVNAIQWNSDGFTIIPANYNFNLASATHSYIALKV